MPTVIRARVNGMTQAIYDQMSEQMLPAGPAGMAPASIEIQQSTRVVTK